MFLFLVSALGCMLHLFSGLAIVCLMSLSCRFYCCWIDGVVCFLFVEERVV